MNNNNNQNDIIENQPTESIQITSTTVNYEEINEIFVNNTVNINSEEIYYDSKEFIEDSNLSTKKIKKGKLINDFYPHALIWICHHGLGKHPKKRKSWNGAALNIIGIYSSFNKANEKRNQLIAEHAPKKGIGGLGDILVGNGGWENEIDLVVKPADCYFDE